MAPSINQLIVSILVDFNLTEVPVIVCIVQVSNTDPKTLYDALSEQEKARALRFRQPKDFERFVAAHSLKRAILGRCLNVSPHSLTFGLGAHGKPFCSHPEAPYFNISHSEDWVVIGLSLFSGVGVDIEFSRDIDYGSIVGRVCDPVQITSFTGSGSSEERFLCFWTQKEAIAKACGKGISVGLPGIPCSGRFGSEELTFLNQPYWLWTQRWGDGGVLSVAANTGGQPKCFTATQLDGFYFSFQYDDLANDWLSRLMG